MIFLFSLVSNSSCSASRVRGNPFETRILPVDFFLWNVYFSLETRSLSPFALYHPHLQMCQIPSNVFTYLVSL
jgi:hypothetical protein